MQTKEGKVVLFIGRLSEALKRGGFHDGFAEGDDGVRHFHLHLREDLAKVIENAIKVELTSAQQDVLTRLLHLENGRG